MRAQQIFNHSLVLSRSYGTKINSGTERANQLQRKNEKNRLTFFWFLYCDWVVCFICCWPPCYGTTFSVCNRCSRS